MATNDNKYMYRITWGIILACLLFAIAMAMVGCEKPVEDDPDNIRSQRIELEDRTIIVWDELQKIKTKEDLPLTAVLSVDGYHFQYPGDTPVNSPHVYLFDGVYWRDMAHPKMKAKYAAVRYFIENSDTSWSYIQYPDDPLFGKMRFCATLDEYESGGCYFMQPCSVYEFDWSAIVYTGSFPNLIDSIEHKGVVSRVNPSEDTPNYQCP